VILTKANLNSAKKVPTEKVASNLSIAESDFQIKISNLWNNNTNAVQISDNLIARSGTKRFPVGIEKLSAQ